MISKDQKLNIICTIDECGETILLNGSEIWGVFKTNSKACKKDETFLFQYIYQRTNGPVNAHLISRPRTK